MAITYVPTVDLPTETQPKRQHGGWTPRPHPRIALGLGSDDELFLLQNETNVSWVVYHDFHQLGIIDPGELLAFHLWKHGTLSIRPCATRDSVEYILLKLNYDVDLVSIYKHAIAPGVEVYDMRIATPEWVHAFVRPRREEGER